MVKCWISTIIVAIIITIGAFCENYFVSKSFNDIFLEAKICQQKSQNQTIVEDDILSLQKLWLDKKSTLHIWIPHNEIKEIELWIAESVKCCKNKKYTDTTEKLEVVLELTEQIPKTFLISWENIL